MQFVLWNPKRIDPILLAFVNFWRDSNKIVDELSGKVAFHQIFQDKNPIVASCKKQYVKV